MPRNVLVAIAVADDVAFFVRSTYTKKEETRQLVEVSFAIFNFSSAVNSSKVHELSGFDFSEPLRSHVVVLGKICTRVCITSCISYWVQTAGLRTRTVCYQVYIIASKEFSAILHSSNISDHGQWIQIDRYR